MCIAPSQITYIFHCIITSTSTKSTSASILHLLPLSMKPPPAMDTLIQSASTHPLPVHTYILDTCSVLLRHPYPCPVHYSLLSCLTTTHASYRIIHIPYCPTSHMHLQCNNLHINMQRHDPRSPRSSSLLQYPFQPFLYMPLISSQIEPLFHPFCNYCTTYCQIKPASIAHVTSGRTEMPTVWPIQYLTSVHVAPPCIHLLITPSHCGRRKGHATLPSDSSCPFSLISHPTHHPHKLPHFFPDPFDYPPFATPHIIFCTAYPIL